MNKKLLTGSILYFIFMVTALLHNFSSASGKSTINMAVGVVEGFYWESDQSVDGQWGQYSLKQRLELISLISTNSINVYWFVPQLIDSVKMWSENEKAGWIETAKHGASVDVKIVYGLRPGWLSADFTRIISKVREIEAVGLMSYSLNFDDAEGVATQKQQELEVKLANELKLLFPSMELYAVVPYCYFQKLVGSKSDWNRALKVIDRISDKTASMVFTGKDVTPDIMNTSDFPDLSSGRRKMFWDNWIAVDTSKRIPWGLISDASRHSDLYTNNFGYMLNLAFPLERVIHQISCLGKLSKGLTCSSGNGAQDWANWLNAQGFLNKTDNINIRNITKALKDFIDADTFFESIEEMENAMPILKGIFSKN